MNTNFCTLKTSLIDALQIQNIQFLANGAGIFASVILEGGQKNMTFRDIS